MEEGQEKRMPLELKAAIVGSWQHSENSQNDHNSDYQNCQDESSCQIIIFVPGHGYKIAVSRL